MRIIDFYNRREHNFLLQHNSFDFFIFIWTSRVAVVSTSIILQTIKRLSKINLYILRTKRILPLRSFFLGNVRRPIFLLELLPSVRDIMTPRRRGISDSQDPDDSVKSSCLCKKIFKLIFCILLTQN